MFPQDGDPVERRLPPVGQVQILLCLGFAQHPRRIQYTRRRKNVSVPSGTDVGLLHEREAVHMLSRP